MVQYSLWTRIFLLVSCVLVVGGSAGLLLGLVYSILTVSISVIGILVPWMAGSCGVICFYALRPRRMFTNLTYELGLYETHQLRFLNGL